MNAAQIIALWPSATALARDIGVPYPTVASWRRRRSIPVSQWRRVTDAAGKRGLPVTALDLVAAHADEEVLKRAEQSAARGPAAVSSGHFSRWFSVRRSNFGSMDEIIAHVRSVRDGETA